MSMKRRMKDGGSFQRVKERRERRRESERDDLDNLLFICHCSLVIICYY